MVDLDEDMSDEDAPYDATGYEITNYQNEEEDEEERSILLKPPDEREQIEDEIEDLEDTVPQLRDDYQIIDRLGTGTFSSVYKAIDLCYHTKWDNAPWHSHHPPESSAHYQSLPHPKGSKVFVAIKRIYVTSGPERIRNEISIMEDCRGCRHVSQLITAFRHHDQVVAIMPYNRNEDFRVSNYNWHFRRISSFAGLLPFDISQRNKSLCSVHVSCPTRCTFEGNHPP